MSALKGDETPEEKAKHVAHLRTFSALPKKVRYDKASKLPTWVKRAIFYHDACGMTWRQVCAVVTPKVRDGKKVPRNPDSLKSWLPTPGAKQWRASIKEVIDDPVVAAKMLAKHDSPHLLLMAYEHLQMCKDAGDISEYGKMLRELMKTATLSDVSANNVPGPTVVQINIAPGQTFSTELPMGSATVEKIIDAEIVEEA